MQQSTSSFGFGIGNAWILPNAVAGFQAVNPTPLTLQAIQDFNVDISSKGVALRDQHGFPIDKRTADYDVKGKFDVAMTDFNLIANAIFGQFATETTAGEKMHEFESQVIPYSTQSILVTGSATFSQDAGVVLASNPATEFVRVTGSPLRGQYKLDTTVGQYDFNAGDEGEAVLISYLTDDGATLQVQNFLQGQTLACTLVAYNIVTGDGVYIANCRFTSFKKTPKRDGYTMYELNFEGYVPYGTNAIEFI